VRFAQRGRGGIERCGGTVQLCRRGDGASCAVAAPVLAVVVRPVDDALMPGRELAEHGYVDADIPPELRTGRTPQYSVQRRRVIEDAGALLQKS